MADLSQLYALTLQRVLKGMGDNIFNSHAFYLKLGKTPEGIQRVTGGRQIEWRARYAVQPGQWGTKGTVLNTDNVDHDLDTVFQFKHLYTPIEIWGEDEAKIQGDAAQVNFVNDQTTWAIDSAQESLNAALFNDGTNPLAVEGVQKAIANDPTTGAYGEVDPAVYTWWRNMYNTHPDIGALPITAAVAFNTATAGRNAMTYMFNACTWKSTPNLIITTALIGTSYQLSLFATLQTQMTDQDIAQYKIPHNGMFMNTPVIPDKQCVVGQMYFLNTSTFRFIMLSGNDFKVGDWKLAQTNDKKVAHIIVRGNLVCCSRRHNGVIYGITA